MTDTLFTTQSFFDYSNEMRDRLGRTLSSLGTAVYLPLFVGDDVEQATNRTVEDWVKLAQLTVPIIDPEKKQVSSIQTGDEARPPYLVYVVVPITGGDAELFNITPNIVGGGVIEGSIYGSDLRLPFLVRVAESEVIKTFFNRRIEEINSRLTMFPALVEEHNKSLPAIVKYWLDKQTQHKKNVAALSNW